MNKIVLETQGLQKYIPMVQGNLDILQQIDLTVTAGESIAITGTSGSGKSTLLGILAGLDQASAGEIHLLGEALHGMNEDQRANLRLGRVGFVFQAFHLLDNLTALENVMLPLELEHSPESARQAAEKALQRVGLGERLHHFVKQLSGGEQQRVALARAFVIQPEILFADEPTGNLDNATGEEIIQLLFDLQRDAETTLVLVTHDTDLANRCQRHYRLINGVLQEQTEL